MKKILASDCSIDSAMKLRNEIEDILGLPRKTILVSTSSTRCRDVGIEVLLRYGAGYGSLPNEPEFGNLEFTEICVNKLRTTEAFRDVVPMPEFIQNRLPEDSEFPVLIRETLTGSKSEGVHFVENREAFDILWKNGIYWTRYFHHSMEVRAYLYITKKGEMQCRLYKKIHRDGNEDSVDNLEGVDNTEWSLRSTNYYPRLVESLERISHRFAELGGKFAALDFIYHDKSKTYVLLEINSGPWLSKTTAQWFAKLFLADYPQ